MGPKLGEVFFALCCAWAFILHPTAGEKRLRLRSRMNIVDSPNLPGIPTTDTTFPQQLSTSTTGLAPEATPTSPESAGTTPRRRQRRRRRRKRINSSTNTANKGDSDSSLSSSGLQKRGGRLPREPLYEEHLDEQFVPDHYYSPIRRQRYKKKKSYFSRPKSTSSTSDYDDSSSVYSKRRTPKPAVQGFDYSSYGFQPTGHPQPQPPPKNYAFAYAVRDDHNAEDFSHKEARDGKLTMGEYRINLPDGRVQVVRYTAGGDIGYKADVTYEGDDPRNKELISKPYHHYNQPKTPRPYKKPVLPRFRSTSPTASSGLPRSRSTSQSGYNSFNIPSSIEKVAPKSIYDKITPYHGSSRFDHGIPEELNVLHEKSPRAGPRRRDKLATNLGLDLRSSFQYHQSTKRPRSRSKIYKQRERVRKQYEEDDSHAAPLYNEPGPGVYFSTSAKPKKFPKPASPTPIYPSPSPTLGTGKGPVVPFSYTVQDNEDGSSTPGYTPIITNLNDLIPIEDFKAGPKRRRRKKKPRISNTSLGGHRESPYYSTNKGALVPSGPRYKEPFHYYNSFHPSYHHGGYSEPTDNNGNSKKPALEKYTVDFPGGSHSFYQPAPKKRLRKKPRKKKISKYSTTIAPSHYDSNTRSSNYRTKSPAIFSTLNKYTDEHDSNEGYHSDEGFSYVTTEPKYPSGVRRRKPTSTSSGLVYLETPGIGPRPTQLGVKDVLSQLPNMPTTVHPYEVGAKDYGNSVAYKNPDKPRIRNSFNTPSSPEELTDYKYPREEAYHQPPRDYLVAQPEYIVGGEQEPVLVSQPVLGGENLGEVTAQGLTDEGLLFTSELPLGAVTTFDTPLQQIQYVKKK